MNQEHLKKELIDQNDQNDQNDQKNKWIKDLTLAVLTFFFMLFVTNGCGHSPAASLDAVSQRSSLENKKGDNHADLKQDLKTIQPGDLAWVNYTAFFENGMIIDSTYAHVADETHKKKVKWFQKPDSFGPILVLAGGNPVSFPDLGKEITGMTAGEKKELIFLPEKGFGWVDPGRIINLPLVKKMPPTIVMKPDEYIDKLKTFPVKGDLVDLVPYFKARVVNVTPHFTTLKFLAENKSRLEEDFGWVDIFTDEKEITVKLTPRIGSIFALNGRPGRIVSTDGISFNVDFNHPAAGKNILLGIEIASIIKAADLKAFQISWTPDYDTAIELSKNENKPVVFVLYADWCGWSQKILKDVCKNPKITILSNKFVWLKIDSDKEVEYKESFNQSGFPLIIILNSKGDEIKRLEGFKDAETLRRELLKCLATQSVG